jgi:predicted dehydrogenase
MKDQVRLGLIGMGAIARHHLYQLAKIPEAVIVGIAEPNQAALERMLSQFPDLVEVPTFTDYRDLLVRADVDAVEIHTPHHQHYEQAMAVFGAGKHLLLEKPMVAHAAEARRLIDAGKDVVFMISYQRHFESNYIYIRDQVLSGALGNIQYLHGMYSQSWLRETSGSWRQVRELSGGGAFNDPGSHYVDIMLWTTGLVAESVFASMQNFNTEVDINSIVSIRFTNGAQGAVSIVGNSPLWWEEFSIWGSKEMILIRQGKLLQGSFGDKEMHLVTELPLGSNPDRNFIDAILGRDSVRVPPECGLRVVELTEAVDRSAGSGRPVKISELYTNQ